MVKRLSMVVVLLAVTMIPGPLSGDTQTEYTECMDRAITHKYDMIRSGVSYQEAHEHYIWHTKVCYSRYYGDGSGMVIEQ
jgi:hypothetical protein